MKKFNYFLLFTLIVTAAVLLNSCIEFDRKIKINKDGSGSEQMRIDFGKDFFDLMISLRAIGDSTSLKSYTDSLYNDEYFIGDTKEKMKNVEGIHINKLYSETNPDSSKSMYIDYDFDNIQLISQTGYTQDENVKSKSKTITNWFEKGDKIIFEMYIEPSTDTTNESADSSYKNLMISFFESKELKYEIEFPYDIESTNAWSYSGRKATWKFQMSDILKDENILHLTVVMKK